jgi:hypothetical protein
MIILVVLMQELIQVDLMELAHVQNMIQIQQDIREVVNG